MDHLAYIVPAYGITLLLALWLGVGAAMRMTRARKKLAAVDPRGAR
jgi:hypothetical protein